MTRKTIRVVINPIDHFDLNLIELKLWRWMLMCHKLITIIITDWLRFVEYYLEQLRLYLTNVYRNVSNCWQNLKIDVPSNPNFFAMKKIVKILSHYNQLLISYDNLRHIVNHTIDQAVKQIFFSVRVCTTIDYLDSW